MASVGGWLGGSLTAAEAPKGQTDAAPARPIEDAKKEFDALKAAREAEQRGQGTALPRVAVPEMHTGLGDPRPKPGAKASNASDPAKKSANWLVNAMAREPGARRDGDRGRGDSLAPRDRRETDAVGREGSVDGVAVEASVDDSRSGPPALSARESRGAADTGKEKSGEVPNPLNRFLAEWLTPRDYATLKPSLTDGLAADRGGRGGLGEIVLPASMGGGLSGIALPGAGAAAPAEADALGAGLKSPASAAPRENPYLQTFTLPPPPLAGPPAAPPLPAPSAVGPAAAPVLAPVPGAPASTPAMPDFARPAQDEKYFKQLKRF